MMEIKLFNTLSGKKEVFRPLRRGEVRMYVCGPTPYDYSHVGHARTYTAFDVIHRWLEKRGFKVKWVMNITDVDDKIIKKAQEEGVTTTELVTRFSQEFFRDMYILDIHPDIYCFATGHISEMLEVIKKLVEKDYAYVIKDGVYFDVDKFKDYGKLSKQKREELVKHRIEPNPNKRNPGDFALWKFKKPREPNWPSPWGNGRPGWHIECSVMSSKYLGEQFDIHGGGSDLIFPHHENEIAQSEAASGKKPWVKYWLHTGFLNIKGEKMSKSLGNIIPIREALKKWGPEVLRLFFVSKHYRSPIDFREEHLEQTRESLERIYNLLDLLKLLRKSKGVLSEAEIELKEKVKNAKKEFVQAMDDDFNTPKALASVFNLVKEINRFIKNKNEINEALYREIDSFFKDFSSVFGVLQKEREIKEEIVRELIELVIVVRDELRRQKLFALSDEIRKKLKELGVVVEDTKQGTRWRFQH